MRIAVNNQTSEGKCYFGRWDNVLPNNADNDNPADFSDVNISGELTKPEGAYVGVRKNVKFKNFIKVRQNFRPEIFASADNI